MLWLNARMRVGEKGSLSGPRVRRFRGLAVFVFVLGLIIPAGGCLSGAGSTPPTKTYSGDLSCMIVATNAEGMSSEDSFESAAILVRRGDGQYELDGTLLEVGAFVLRAIATADLQFEITELETADDEVTFVAEPRPTLPGITATGTLMEAYQVQDGMVEATRELDIDVTDVSTTINISGNCSGSLMEE